jgi:hypothetical protein
MANTYTLIASNTLSTSAATVTFSSIPATFTDLALRLSTRTTPANLNSLISVRLNSDTTTNYSVRILNGNGETVSSSGSTSATTIGSGGITSAASSTADTFGSGEIYFPNYTNSTIKAWGSFSASESNSATGVNIRATANLYQGTSPITTIRFSLTTGSFVSGSSFYLYGIKNS